jgi:hypothetical protein
MSDDITTQTGRDVWELATLVASLQRRAKIALMPELADLEAVHAELGRLITRLKDHREIETVMAEIRGNVAGNL